MNFEFHNLTRLLFGGRNLARLGAVVREKGKRALLVTGGGSVKRNGAFARAVASLEQAGVSFIECSGIEPNPRISSVARGARIAWLHIPSHTDVSRPVDRVGAGELHPILRSPQA